MKQWFRKLDWKYFLTFIMAFAAVYIAALPYLQSPAKDIQIQQISQVALEPTVPNNQSLGLEITIDKIAVHEPYLTVLKISNTGREPIYTKDFESPLEIIIGQDKSILRAQVSEKNPDDLKPIIRTNKNIMSLDPMLLNPKDVMTLSILSANGLPNFKSSARIAGIKKITITTQDDQNKNSYTAVLSGAFAILLLVLAAAGMEQFESPKQKLLTFNRRTVFLFIISFLFAAIFFWQAALRLYGYWSVSNYLISLLVMSLITAPIGMWLEKRSKQTETNNQND